MVAQPYRSKMSIENYLALDRDSIEIRYEFIDGYVCIMSGGTANHSTISVNITSLLSQLLEGSPCRVYNSDMRVRLSEERYVYPDVSVSCNERDRGSVETIQSPRLIVEVLSPSTEAYDRGDKFGYYRSCPTIEEYILVNTQREVVEVYRKARPNLWTLHFFEAGDYVELASLDVRFPISTIYRNVLFAGEDAPEIS